jgi:hypothetical protein
MHWQCQWRKKSHRRLARVGSHSFLFVLAKKKMSGVAIDGLNDTMGQLTDKGAGVVRVCFTRTTLDRSQLCARSHQSVATYMHRK